MCILCGGKCCGAGNTIIYLSGMLLTFLGIKIKTKFNKILKFKKSNKK